MYYCIPQTGAACDLNFWGGTPIGICNIFISKGGGGGGMKKKSKRKGKVQKQNDQDIDFLTFLVNSI